MTKTKSKKKLLAGKITVDVYDWTIHWIIVQPETAIQAVKKLQLFQRGAAMERNAFETEIEWIQSGHHNGGWHSFDVFARDSVITILPCTSTDQLINTLSHEIDHAVWTIVSHCQLGKEASAYLQGYLFEKIFPHVFDIKIKK